MSTPPNKEVPGWT